MVVEEASIEGALVEGGSSEVGADVGAGGGTTSTTDAAGTFVSAVESGADVEWRVFEVSNTIVESSATAVSTFGIFAGVLEGPATDDSSAASACSASTSIAFALPLPLVARDFLAGLEEVVVVVEVVRFRLVGAGCTRTSSSTCASSILHSKDERDAWGKKRQH